MVLPALLGIFSGGSAITKGLTGLLQGGGFGLGYGFGVRMGYDAYGGLKKALGLDTVEGTKKKMATARYNTHPFVSHLGSGALMGLDKVLK